VVRRTGHGRLIQRSEGGEGQGTKGVPRMGEWGSQLILEVKRRDRANLGGR